MKRLKNKPTLTPFPCIRKSTKCSHFFCCVVFCCSANARRCFAATRRAWVAPTSKVSLEEQKGSNALYCQKYLPVCLHTHMKLTDITYDVKACFLCSYNSSSASEYFPKGLEVCLWEFDYSSRSAFVSQIKSILSGCASGLCAEVSRSTTPTILQNMDGPFLFQ